MVKQALKSLNGRKVKIIGLGGVLSTIALGWIAWVTKGNEASGQANVRQDQWIAGHEAWTETKVFDIEELIHRNDAIGVEDRELIRKNIEERAEMDKQYRTWDKELREKQAAWDTERWTEQHKANDRIDAKLDRVIEKLEEKPP